MIDKALAIGGFLNWFGYLWAIVQDIINWPVVGYVVPLDAGWTTPVLRRMLAERGVKILAPRLGWSTLVFSVRKRDAWMTQAVLDAALVPYRGGRTFKRPPFLPGAQAGQGSAQAAATAHGGDWTAQAAAQLQARRAAKGR